MKLWKSDLVRYFAVGFIVGAIGIYATFGLGPDRVTPGDVVPTAVAAPVR